MSAKLKVRVARLQNEVCTKYFFRATNQGRVNHEVQTVNWNTGIFEAESA